jgi:hypothetical protein
VNSKPLQNWPPEVQTKHGGWMIILQIAMVTVASGAIAYVATNPQQLARTAAAVVAPAREIAVPKPAPPPPIQTEPVRFTNPFDRTEIFEFPSGTSETAARQSVAELLMERAHERRNAWFRAKHPNNRPPTLARVSDPDDGSGRRACLAYSGC